MPGVRGRPRGCATCKKRKVLCDLQKPECQRCIKSKATCPGYEHATTFVNRNVSNFEVSGREILSSAFRGPSTSKAPPMCVAKSPNDSFAPILPGSKILALSEKASDPAPDLNMVRKIVVKKSLEDHWDLQSTSNNRGPMFGLLMRYFTAEGTALNLANLYFALSKFLNPTEMFDHAVSATALTRGGQVNNDKQLLHEGTLKYLLAIQGLQDALKHPVYSLQDATLGVCVLLSAYELIVGSATSMEPWIKHMEGISHLIQMRGPERHQIAFGHQIFLHFRANAALCAMMTRKHTFLADPKWLEVPFQSEPKDIFHHMLDPIFGFATVLEALDGAKRNSHGATAIRQQIATNCASIHTCLGQWYQTFTGLFPFTLYSSIPSHKFVSEDERGGSLVFPDYLRFVEFRFVQIMITYWGTSIYLHTVTTSNLRILNRPPPPPTEHDRCTQFAYLIAKSMPYCLQECFRTSGPIIIIHPLHVVMQWFGHIGKDREWRWCEQLFEKVVRGGNPFRDAGEGEGIEVGREGEKPIRQQLCLPRYGRGCLRLEF